MKQDQKKTTPNKKDNAGENVTITEEYKAYIETIHKLTPEYQHLSAVEIARLALEQGLVDKILKLKEAKEQFKQRKQEEMQIVHQVIADTASIEE